MNLSLLLQQIRVDADLEASCPHGTVQISSSQDSELLDIHCSNGRVFRYLLSTLAAFGNLRDGWQQLQSLSDSPQIIQVRVEGRPILRLGAGQRKLQWLSLLRHWLRSRTDR